MPQTLLGWSRSPNAPHFNTLGTETLGPITTTTGAIANTVVNSPLMLGCTVKLRKVGVAYTAIGSVAGTFAFNVAVGYGAETTLAPNDNSFASGTLLPTAGTATTGAGTYVAAAGVGYPTNVATAGMIAFSQDIQFLAPGVTVPGYTSPGPYAPGWIVGATTGGYGVFTPPNYDAVYPGLVPMTLRLVQPAAGVITGLVVTLFYEPVTPLANPGSGTTASEPQCTPGASF